MVPFAPALHKRVKVRWNSKVLDYCGGAEAITLYPYIFFKRDFNYYMITQPTILRHELEHIYQAERMLVVPFYIMYLWEWVKNLIKHGPNYWAYYYIKYEISARATENTPLTDEEWRVYGVESVRPTQPAA